MIPRAQNSDAKSRGTRDNDVRLRRVEHGGVPLRHVAPNPSHLPDVAFRSEHAREDERWGHRGNNAHEVNPIRGICGAHGGDETVNCRSAQCTEN